MIPFQFALRRRMMMAGGGGASISDLPLGTLIRIADSDGGAGTPNYEIADKDNLVSGGVVLVRKNIHSKSAFGSSPTYPGSTLDILIKTTIYNEMPQQLRDKMMDVTFNLSGSGDITRKMFALTKTMAGLGNNSGVAEGKALQLYTSDASRKKTFNGTAAGWWLSSQSYSDYAWDVRTDGSAYGSHNSSNSYGVVPAFAIPQSVMLEDSANEDGSYNIMMMAEGGGLPPAGTPLNNFTWAQIDYISENGLVSDYFNIGDTKNVTIGSATYVVEIVGFSHDDKADGSGKAGLTFGLKDCLNTAYKMNSSNTNVGGWGSCALRATLRGDIWNQLPSDLRGVIKEVTKKASAGNSSSTISSYTDTLFLFAEKEIFGSTQFSVNGEGTQYARFTTSDTRIKKLNGSATRWWLRSPYSGSASYFCYVHSRGTANYGYASTSYGVAFGFCV